MNRLLLLPHLVLALAQTACDPAPPAEQKQVGEEEKPAFVLTRENFKAVRKGMPLEAVKQLLGDSKGSHNPTRGLIREQFADGNNNAYVLFLVTDNAPE